MTTINISEDVHKRLLVKQLELKKKFRIQDIVEYLIEKNIDNIETMEEYDIRVSNMQK